MILFFLIFCFIGFINLAVDLTVDVAVDQGVDVAVDVAVDADVDVAEARHLVSIYW